MSDGNSPGSESSSPVAVDARGGREQQRDQGGVKILANDQHGRRREQSDVLARHVLAQA